MQESGYLYYIKILSFEPFAGDRYAGAQPRADGWHHEAREEADHVHEHQQHTT